MTQTPQAANEKKTDKFDYMKIKIFCLGGKNHKQRQMLKQRTISNINHRQRADFFHSHIRNAYKSIRSTKPNGPSANITENQNSAQTH